MRQGFNSINTSNDTEVYLEYFGGFIESIEKKLNIIFSATVRTQQIEAFKNMYQPLLENLQPENTPYKKDHEMSPHLMDTYIKTHKNALLNGAILPIPLFVEQRGELLVSTVIFLKKKSHIKKIIGVMIGLVGGIILGEDLVGEGA